VENANGKKDNQVYIAWKDEWEALDQSQQAQIRAELSEVIVIGWMDERNELAV
jgi:hypothetical protein